MLISSSNQYSEYAKSGDVITIRLISSIPFQKYEKKPNEASFLMTLASWKDDNIYLSNVEANSCTVTGTTCKIIYIVPDMEDVEMPVRNKIYFIYNDNSEGAFYRRAGETDENMQISDNLMLDNNGDRRYIEYEKIQEEIKLARATNKSVNNEGTIVKEELRKNVNSLDNWRYTSWQGENRAKFTIENVTYYIEQDGFIGKSSTYKFTVKANPENSLIEIVNLDENYTVSNKDENGNYSDELTVDVEGGATISYNVTKDYYRYDDGSDVGSKEPIEMIAPNHDTVIEVELKQNPEFPGLVTTEHFTYNPSQSLNSSSGWKNCTVSSQYANIVNMIRLSNVSITNISQIKDTTSYVRLYSNASRVTGGTSSASIIVFPNNSVNISGKGGSSSINNTGIIYEYDSNNYPASIINANICMRVKTDWESKYEWFNANKISGTLSGDVVYVEK